MESINGTDSRQIALDLLLPVGVAVGLVFIHLLVPLRMRSSLAFTPNWFTFHSLITAPYVHADAVHLVENTALFLVTASLVYALTLFVRLRKWFHVTAPALLLGLPIVHNLLVYLIAQAFGIEDLAAQFGFSSIGAGFAAFLLVATVVYIFDGYGRKGVAAFVSLLAVIVAAVMVLSFVSDISTVLIGAGVISPLLAMGWYRCRQTKTLRRPARIESPIPTDATVLTLAMLVLVLEISSLFQVGMDPVSVGLSHAIPFGLGLIISVLAYWFVGLSMTQNNGQTRRD